MKSFKEYLKEQSAAIPEGGHAQDFLGLLRFCGYPPNIECMRKHGWLVNKHGVWYHKDCGGNGCTFMRCGAMGCEQFYPSINPEPDEQDLDQDWDPRVKPDKDLIIPTHDE